VTKPAWYTPHAEAIFYFVNAGHSISVLSRPRGLLGCCGESRPSSSEGGPGKQSAVLPDRPWRRWEGASGADNAGAAGTARRSVR